jgi:cell division protein FtsN
MNPQSTETGQELVLDNRKLILGFLLLVALCGGCFVIGFMEGKRQAIQAKLDAMTRSLPATPPVAAASESGSKAAEKAAEIASGKNKSVKGQLDWYENVRSGEAAAAKAASPTTKGVTPDKPAPSVKSPSVAAPREERAGAVIPGVRPTYTVQVGAFRQPREAESRAAALKEKGFECLIEAPKTEGQLYTVKVGRFESRAEAVAMQRKLTKVGFSCYIKTN